MPLIKIKVVYSDQCGRNFYIVFCATWRSHVVSHPGPNQVCPCLASETKTRSDVVMAAN